MESFSFYSMSAVALVSALLVVTLRNAVHSALFLGLSLAAVGGLYAVLGADFLFGGQILVYVGGIAVLIMFVVMLLGRASDLHLRQVNNQWMAALLVCGISFLGLWKVIGLFTASKTQTPPRPTTHELGRLMLAEYAVPFELISLVLLAALLGAIFFSHIDKKEPS
ncbi:MAG: NADH-quinone oxidoreductase subunit J [Elusimicrobia bacterium]|nr:NADH-quinone oxidoreductase subunit J [Elusimicrobiota bacterium]